MKKALSIMLAALMLVSAFSMLAIGAAAEDAPSGQIWEGETDLVFSDFVNSGSGDVIGHGNDFENSGKMSQNGFLLWRPAAEGESVEFALQVETEGKKTLMFQYLAAQDLGICDIYWDGALVRENLDMYVPVEQRDMVELNLGEMEITQGVHKLKLVYKGKNADSSKDQISIDYVELVGKDGTRRFVNQKTAKDDYKKITRFEDGTIRYEIEAMEKTVTTQKLKVETQIYKGWDTEIPWGYSAHMRWVDAKEGDKASFKFFVDRAGEYELNFQSALASDRGIVEIQIDSAPLLTVNQYNDGDMCKQYGPEDTIMLKAGYHTLTLVHKGRSEDAKNTRISLDFMEIKRVGGFVRTGQIWEGETELMGYGGTEIKYNINGTDYEYVGGTPNKALPHLKSETKLNHNAAVNPSGDHHTRFLPDNSNAWIEFTLDVKTVGEKDVYLQCWVGTESAKYKVTWRSEGVALEDAIVLAEELDFYNSSWVYKEDNLGKVTVAPGKYILRFECVGKNEAMGNNHYGMAVDYFELVGEDGVRRTQKRDTRGSDFDKVYYADDGTVRHIIWNMPVDKKTQENLDNGVYTKKIEKNTNMNNGGFAVGAQKLVLNDLAQHVGTQTKPEYTVKFYVDKNGYYSVNAGMGHFKENSLVSFKINGTPVGEVVDQCSQFITASYINLTPSLYLKEGWNTFTIVFEGRSPNNKNTAARIEFDFFELYEISSGEPFEIDPECTPETGDATIYVVIALCVSAMALAIPAVTWAKKKKASK